MPAASKKIITFILTTLFVVACSNDKPPAASTKEATNETFATDKKKAEAGDATAQALVGRAYIDGMGVATDEAKALEWIKKSSTQGNPQGLYELAQVYWNGKIIEQDYKEACRLAHMAADQNNRSGQLLLSGCYELGLGGEKKNPGKAASLQESAAAQGLPRAQYFIGQKYFYGVGVTLDQEKGVQWLIKAAENNIVDAQYKLGSIYENGYGSHGQNEKAAYQWYQKAADAGNVDALATIGRAYSLGVGGYKIDEAEGGKWYQKAADKGDPQSMFNIGIYYQDGKFGYKKDATQALNWFKKSAEKNYPDALYQMGSVYLNGFADLSKDEAEAARWFRKAAELAHQDSQLTLVKLYTEGRGVKKDMKEAARWQRKADANHGEK